MGMSVEDEDRYELMKARHEKNTAVRVTHTGKNVSNMKQIFMGIREEFSDIGHPFDDDDLCWDLREYFRSLTSSIAPLIVSLQESCMDSCGVRSTRERGLLPSPWTV